MSIKYQVENISRLMLLTVANVLEICFRWLYGVMHAFSQVSNSICQACEAIKFMQVAVGVLINVSLPLTASIHSRKTIMS